MSKEKKKFLSLDKNFLELQLYKFKKYFFKNDKTIFIASLLLLFGGVLLYYILILIGKKICVFPIAWDFSIFFPFWVSFVSLVLTILVSLKLSLKKTEDAKDFIEILSGEINRTSNSEIFHIIIPNLNVAQYNFPDEFRKFKDVIEKATTRGVKISFITLGIDKDYIGSYNHSEKMPYKSLFFQDGEKHNSPALTYIFDRYSPTLDTIQYDETITYFKTLFQNTNISFFNCTLELSKTNILGFSSNKIAFIGKYYDFNSRTGRVKVEGEIIDTSEAVALINEFLIEKIKATYLIPLETSCNDISTSNQNKSN